jgi:hypothetical protein
MKNYSVRIVWALACVLIIATTPVLAQITTATMYGVVEDPSGASVPKAVVTLIADSTGVRTRGASDVNGEFTFTFLVPGKYSIAIEAAGFKLLQRSGIELKPGEGVRLTLKLELGNTSEKVTVTAAAPLVNTTNVQQSEALDATHVEQLPIPDRDWTNLVPLTTGAQLSGEGVSLNGFGSATFSFTVDGTDASGSQEYPDFGLYGTYNLVKGVSEEAISEVQVAKGITSAEIGNTEAGNVNIFTKSGTNAFHGSLFENYNTVGLNSRNRFLSYKPHSVLNQFGGSFGGPIKRDKLFFFGVYEGNRAGSLALDDGEVPTPEFKAQVIAAVPAYGPLLNLFPNPTVAYNPGDQVAFWESVGSNKISDNHVDTRVDYYLGTRSRLDVRFTRARPYQSYPIDVLPQVNLEAYHGQYDVIGANYTFAQSALSAETRFGFTRSVTLRLDGLFNTHDTGIYTPLFGAGDSENMDTGGKTISFQEVVAIMHGRHSIKFGGQFVTMPAGRTDAESGYYIYSTMSDFMANIPDEAVFTYGVGPVPGDISAGRYVASNWRLGSFIQDDFKVTRKLVLNLGLRYDDFSVPKVGDHLYSRSDGGFGPLRPFDSIYNANRTDFSPRVGFNYSPGQSGKTVINGGFGEFYNPHTLFSTAMEMYRNGLNEPFRVIASRQELLDLGIECCEIQTATEPAVTGVGALWTGSSLSEHYPDPYSLQWTLGVQRELAKNLVLETTYVGNHGVHGQMIRDANQVDRITGLRPVAGFGQFRWYDDSGWSTYEAWQSTLRKKTSHGLTFDLHYTWSKSMGNRDADLLLSNGLKPQDNNNLRAEKAPLGFDMTQMFNTDFIYELPFARLVNGDSRGKKIGLAGWQISGIFGGDTGFPLNIVEYNSYNGQRPDLVSGTPVYLSNWKNTQAYLNPAAFSMVPIEPLSGATARPGNLGRDAYRAPGSWNVDLSLAKTMAFSDKIRLQVRADAFSAFNHHYLTGIVTGLQSANFGQFTGVSGDRTMQLGARLTF